jgi:hypothetical protein
VGLCFFISQREAEGFPAQSDGHFSKNGGYNHETHFTLHVVPDGEYFRLRILFGYGT